MTATILEPVPQRTVGSTECIFTVLVLILALGAFQNLTVTGPIETQNMGMLGMQILWSFLYIIMLLFYFGSCVRPIRSLGVVLPLLLLLGFVFASAIWSQDTWLTLRRSIALILTLIFGVYFASRFKLEEQIRLLASAFFVCIIFSFFFELLGLNPDQGVPGWYGVFALKVELGRQMALGTLVFLFWGKVEPKHNALAWTGFFASLALVALSRDMTPLAVLIFLFVLLPYLHVALRRSLLSATGAIVLLLGAGTLFIFYAAANLERLTGLFGKDAMLTGRVPLWILSTAMALQRPWLGYGFNAFWLPDEVYTQRIWHLLGWMPPHAHNGVLELWLELGIIGTSFFLALFVYYVAKAVNFMRRSPSPAAAWPLAFLIFLFLGSLTEAEFLASNSVTFILFVAIAAMVSVGPEIEPFENKLAPRNPSYA